MGIFYICGTNKKLLIFLIVIKVDKIQKFIQCCLADIWAPPYLAYYIKQYLFKLFGIFFWDFSDLYIGGFYFSLCGMFIKSLMGEVK